MNKLQRFVSLKSYFYDCLSDYLSEEQYLGHYNTSDLDVYISLLSHECVELKRQVLNDMTLLQSVSATFSEGSMLDLMADQIFAESDNGKFTNKLLQYWMETLKLSDDEIHRYIAMFFEHFTKFALSPLPTVEAQVFYKQLLDSVLNEKMDTDCGFTCNCDPAQISSDGQNTEDSDCVAVEIKVKKDDDDFDDDFDVERFDDDDDYFPVFDHIVELSNNIERVGVDRAAQILMWRGDSDIQVKRLRKLLKLIKQNL